MKKLRLAFIAMGVLLILFSSGGGNANASEDEYIKIGASLPLSGLAAPWGIQSLQAGEVMAEEVNKAGGIRIDGKMMKMKMIAYDDKYDASIGLKNTNRLISQDRVHVIVYQSGDVPTVCRDLVNKAGIIGWGTAYVKDQPSPKYPYIFAKFLRYPETISSCYHWISKNRPEIKKVAYMAPLEARTQTCVEVLETTAKILGIEIVAKELFPSGTEDFNAVLLKVLAKKPDMIDLTSSFTAECGLIAKQVRGLGFRGPMFHACAAELAGIIEIAGRENAEGFMSGLEVGEPLSPKMQELKEIYLKKYGGPFPTGFFQYWDGYEVLVAAIRKAGNLSADKIAGALRDGEYDTVWGKARMCGKAYYGIDNQIITAIPVSVVRDGKVSQLSWVEGRCAGE